MRYLLLIIGSLLSLTGMAYLFVGDSFADALVSGFIIAVGLFLLLIFHIESSLERK